MSSPSEPEETPNPPSDPVPVELSDDEALILWMLSLTPTQRLEVAQGFVDSVQALRNGRRS
jgi:hypothetical protein